MKACQAKDGRDSEGYSGPRRLSLVGRRQIRSKKCQNGRNSHRAYPGGFEAKAEVPQVKGKEEPRKRTHERGNKGGIKKGRVEVHLSKAESEWDL